MAIYFAKKQDTENRAYYPDFPCLNIILTSLRF